MYELALPLLIALIVVALAFDFLNGLHDAANSTNCRRTRLISPVWAVASLPSSISSLFPRAALAVAGQGRRYDRQGTGRQGFGDSGSCLRRAGGRDVLERGHLAEGHSFLIQPCARRRPRRRGPRSCGLRQHPVVGPQQDPHRHCSVPRARPHADDGDHARDALDGRAGDRAGAERTFRGLHLVSAGAYSLGHGLNDAQKTMGVITVLLYSTGHLHGEFHVPGWVALSCYIAIGLGTLTGGWRIIETMGTRSRSSRSIRDLSLGRRVDLLSGVLPAFPSRRPTPSQVA